MHYHVEYLGKQVLVILFHIGRNESSESPSNLLEITQLEGGSVNIQIQVFLDFEAWTLTSKE
jgi:hypothetical protein